MVSGDYCRTDGEVIAVCEVLNDVSDTVKLDVSLHDKQLFNSGSEGL
jgi:hypothetical protein